MKKFTREFLIATAAHALFLVWYFHAPILSGRVDWIQMHPVAPPQALINMSEMAYEVLPAISVQTREIKEGVFPAWSPYSQGGTPLIGKMQNGVFAPYHILLYALPASWMPFVFTLIIALKSYLAFIFTYLFVRSLRLNVWSGIFAGTLYILQSIDGGIFSWFGPQPYLPLLLLLTECYFKNYRAFAMFLWPWAAALPFLCGHFESAFWINVFAGAYFLIHLWNDASALPREKFNRFLAIAGLSAAGALIAAAQIYPAFEYVNLSYNRIWHLFDWFGWEYQTISKHLSSEDIPMIVLALGGLAAFYAAFKRCWKAQEEWSPKAIAWKAAACALLAWTVACFADLGFDDSLSFLLFPSDDYARVMVWLISFYLVVFAFWEWSQEDQPRGLRILGLVMIGGLFIDSKMPLIANLLANLPVIQHFHNGNSHPWEYELAVSILCAASLERLVNLPAAWAVRVKKALRMFGIVCIFGLGYALSQPLKGILVALIPTGIPPPMAGRSEPPGGIMGPERIRTYNLSHEIAGWTPPYPPPTAVDVAVVNEGQTSGSPLKSVRATVEPSGGRLYFHAGLPLSEPDLKQAELRVVVQVQYPNGTRNMMGPLLQTHARGASWMPYLLMAGLLTFPAVFLLGPLWQKSVYLFLLVFSVLQRQSIPIAASQIPYPLAGIDKIKTDPELFRVSSMQYNFMQADYANVYGISDLRTGGDNLDLLTMIYFNHLSLGLLQNPEDPASFDLGLRFWGLGNAKYLIERPDADLGKAGLEPFYKGPEMSVWKNKYFTPRAAFYDRYVYLPVKDWGDWNNRGQFLAPVARLAGQKDFDWSRTVLLHDIPIINTSSVWDVPNKRSSDVRDVPSASVRIDEYRPDRVSLTVDAPRPGWVFLSDNYFPGWQAFVNGKRSSILRSWITFRAVEVPAGKSNVEFVYKPILLGMILFLTVCACIVWTFYYWRYRLTRPPFETLSAPIQNQKKKRELAPVDNPADWVDCAVMAERIFIPYVGVTLLFWLVWTAFVYKGGPLIPWMARALLTGTIFMFVWSARLKLSNKSAA